MGRLSSVLRSIEGNRVGFWCPGCDEMHMVTVRTDGQHVSGSAWGYNLNPEKPTFTPSILCRWETPSDVPEEFDDDSKNIKHVCHSFVRDGMIEFLPDCTHHLAGFTVPIPEWPKPEGWEDP
jgi:hypothetical protein